MIGKDGLNSWIVAPRSSAKLSTAAVSAGLTARTLASRPVLDGSWADDQHWSPGNGVGNGARRTAPLECSGPGELWGAQVTNVARGAAGQGEAPRIAAIARGGLANLVGAVVSAAANFALVLVVARFLSTGEAGRFFTVTSFFLILETLGRLGADTGIIYFISRWRAMNQESLILPGLRAAFGPVIVLCAAAAAVSFTLAPQFARELAGGSSQSVNLFRLLAVFLPLAAVYDVALGATRGWNWMRPTVLVERIGRPLTQLVLVTAALLVGWKSAVGLAWAVPYVLALFALGLMVRRWLPWRIHLAERRAHVEFRAVARQFWSFALPRAAAGVAQIVLQRLDIVLVAAIRGPHDAAIYTAATRFLVVGQFVNQAITAPIQPQLGAALSAGNVVSARALYRISTTWLVLISWPLSGLAIVFAPIYVSIFGRAYREGTSVVVVLALAMLVASGVGLVDTVIIMAGRASWNMWTTFLALFVNLGADLLLIPRFGIIGAAAGWCAALLASNLVPLALSWRRLKLHPFGASTAWAFALCAGCFFLLPLLGYLLTGNKTAPAVGVVLGVVGYAWGVWRCRTLFHLSGILRRRSRQVSPA